MTSEGAELDLYADDIGDEFSQENEYNDSDLYDDVITSNSKSRAGGSSNNIVAGVSAASDEPIYNGSSNQSQNSNHSNNSGLLPTGASSHIDGGLMNSSKKPCIYVGNLTWWTTDEDVVRSLASVGVIDVHEIKFFENRANGQSKGFCVVTLNQESSVRVALEKLGKIELYGQLMAVTMCNRQNLNHFEMKSRKPGQNGQPERMGNNNQNNNQNNNFGMQNNRNFGQNQGGGVGGNMPGSGGSGRPPLLPRGPLGRPNGPLLNNQPRLPQMPHQAIPFTNPQQWSQLMQNGPRNPMHNSGPQLNPMMRMPQGNRSLNAQPLLNPPTNPGDLRTQLSSVGLSGVGQHPLGGPHVNQLFGSQQSLVPPNVAGDQFGNRFGGMNPYAQGHPGNDFGRSGMDLALQMSEAEFEEILSKNKNLANNAVTRAVSDAASGNFSLFTLF